MTVKTCSKCGTRQPLESFDKHPCGSFGRAHICRVCRARYRRGYYQLRKAEWAAEAVG